MSSMAAAVQSMDEAVINGAQIIYTRQFGIGSGSLHDSVLIGPVNSASYLCCAVIGCWLTDPLNKALGRKKKHFQCSPTAIRGALVMVWQMWTAFGIMLGDLIDLAFYFVPNKPGATGLNWRLMLGSAGIPALIVCCQILRGPRWLIGKGRYEDAFNELRRLRFSKVQAARDLCYIRVLLEAENEVKKGRDRNLLLFTFPWMAVCLLITGFSFWCKTQKGLVAGVSIVIYLFGMFYSPSEGPVPFTYSPEHDLTVHMLGISLYIREFGMPYATALTWLYNFVLAISFPPLLKSFKPPRAFGFYAAWCLILWVLILLFVRETKGKTLEELDQVFAVPIHAEQLYEMEDDSIPDDSRKEDVVHQEKVSDQV
ncbi:hypothetical protein PILCRDRAFT_97317 [Piloderma croceum F 1598]|uniref:Major facilitator superfamily (MFS) profile domain-containing protein n=1 Tax=Piloderma croceum (strain F 1598) TaxID=765440 RepID=A0A0C3FY34_PILCF|nr:hypothetical protein PILCRDRAFT_97317 [Piloderma croceum F 1598]